MIEREGVRARIARAGQFPLTLIIAPAGYGKSTALDQHLAAFDGPKIYHRVQPGDATLARFILGLAEDAGSAFSPQIAQAIVKAHEDFPADGLPQRVASVCAGHFNEQGGIVAIDDLHYAQSHDVVRFLEAVVEQTRGRVRWVATSRSRAHFPLGAWIARALCDVPIEGNALTFSEQDVRRAALESNVQLPDAAVCAIASATGGLPISVALALRYALAGYDVTEVMAQTRLASYEYLTSQMFAHLSETERAYLCFGALLPVLRVDVFEAAGFLDAAEVLQHLFLHSGFVTRRLSAPGADAPEYVCHDIFREYFRHQLQAGGRAEERALQKRAADALTAVRLITAALPLYASAGAFEELAEHLAICGFALVDEGRRGIVQSAIAALPADDPRWRSTVLALRAEFASSTQDYAVVEGLFSAAMDCARNAGERIAIQFRFAQHQHLHDTRGAEQTLEQVVSSPDCPAGLRAHAFAYLLATRTWNDPYYDVQDEIAAFEGMAGLIEADFDRADAMLFACCAATYCGDPRAERLAQATLEIARGCNFVLAQLAVYGTLARNALYHGTDAEEVLEYVRREEELAVQIEGASAKRRVIMLKLGLAMRHGDADGIQQLLRHCTALNAPLDISASSAILRAQALVLAWKGEFGDACQLMKRALAHVYGTYRPIARALCAVFAAAAGRRDEVRDLLTEGREQLKRAKPWNEVLRCNTDAAGQLYAIAAAVAGRQRDALQFARHTSARSGELALTLYDVVRAVLEGPAVALAEEHVLVERLCALGYRDIAMILRPLFQRYDGEQNETERVSLTAQEKAIIEALASGLAPKQIADMMDRRVSTIQGHIRDVVTKLGCSGRAQAIRIARSRGLLRS